MGRLEVEEGLEEGSGECRIEAQVPVFVPSPSPDLMAIIQQIGNEKMLRAGDEMGEG